MLVILHKCSCLLEIFTMKMLLEHVEELWNDRNAIFTDNNTFHLHGADPCVPVMLSNVSYGDTFWWISVQNLFYEIFAFDREWRRYREVTGKDFLVEFICVWIFEGQEAASHCIKDDAAGPDIRGESIVLLASNHLWSCIAWTAACSFKKTTFAIGIWKAKVDNLDILTFIQK